ncbi:thioredoxin domain-containing protein [Pinibacter soli]|uniref:Thioredoxin domain-containing protein n=1 Tax=Pinibacter soli TaxID=3044211 RepID=A0ABT6RD44_9BACT|nr:thioredoxin domain-containing protein [Pinibacter soli]MDI3320316.1 thioredoxin domain-containing protein [Pinibacter soli]
MKNVLIAQVMSVFLISCNLNAQSKTVLSADEFQQQISSNKQLLDVRTSGEYSNGHIANSLQADWNNKEEFKDRVQYLDKNKPVLIYCQVGGRSAAAAKYLRENGFKDVEELQGGMISWKQANKPVAGAADVPEMTTDEFAAKVNVKKIVLVNFGAEWCPPCKKMEPVIEDLQKELNGKFELVKIDGGANTSLMKSMGIDKIPTFIVYKNGKEVWRKQGVVEKDELKKAIEK